jgi:hypothetical protein
MECGRKTNGHMKFQHGMQVDFSSRDYRGENNIATGITVSLSEARQFINEVAHFQYEGDQG